MFKRIIKSKTLRNVGVYSALNFINSSIPFFLLPVLTFRLSKEEYAVVDIFNSLGFIFLPLVGLNIVSSVIRFYFDDEKYNFKEFLSSVLMFLTLSGAAIAFFVYLLRGWLVELTGIEVLYELLFLTVFYSLFEQISEILLSLYRAEGNAVKYGIFRVLKTGFSFGLTVVFIVFIYAGWESRVYTALGVSSAFSLIAIFLLAKALDFKFRFNLGYIKDALLFSGPLIFHNIGSRFVTYIDRFFLLYFYGLEVVGVYAVAYQVGMLMSFVGNSVNMAWVPAFFAKLKRGGEGCKKEIEVLNLLFIVFYFALALVIYLMVPVIYENFIGDEFLVDSSLVLILLLGYALRSCYLMYVNFMFHSKRTFRLSLYTVASAFVNVLFCWILIPAYGLYGAAYATIASIAIQFFLVFYDYKKNLALYY